MILSILVVYLCNHVADWEPCSLHCPASQETVRPHIICLGKDQNSKYGFNWMRIALVSSSKSHKLKHGKLGTLCAVTFWGTRSWDFHMNWRGTQFISWQEGEAEARISWPLWVDIVLSMPVLSNTTYLLSLVAAVPGVSGHRAGMTELVLECLFWWDSGPFRVDTHPSPKGQVDPSQLQSYSLSTTWNKKKLSFLRNEMEFPRYLVLTL